MDWSPVASSTGTSGQTPVPRPRMRRSLFSLLLFCFLATTAAAASEISAPPADAIPTLDLQSPGKRGRVIPVLVYLPESRPAPVILFSHGLGGSRHGYAYLARYWAERGYLVIAMQHPGSDDGVWRNPPKGSTPRQSMEDAASAQNLFFRLQDVHSLLDNLERWNADPGHPLYQRMDLQRVGLGGHSFGAVTTQAVAGQALPMFGNRENDPRIRAALVLSPSWPAGNLAEPFAKVSLPWMLMTGTRDGFPFDDRSPATRREVYKALPPGHKYELVFAGGDHMLFSGSDRGGKTLDDPRLAVIQTFSTFFWDAWLKNDGEAQAWLEGSAPRALLAPDDEWRKK